MTNYYLRKATLLILALCLAAMGEAKVSLPALIADGMVLQRGEPLTIWGTADAGEEVQVQFLKKKYRTQADDRGNWQIELPSLKAGGPYVMHINDLTVNDILVGDVFLCSGQSNMELPISRVTDMFADEVKEYENPNIRYFRVPIRHNFHEPQDNLSSGRWDALTRETVMNYSALVYFFAKRLIETTGVPVGIVNSSMGGSPVEAWMSEESLADFPEIRNNLGMLRSDEFIKANEELDRMRQNLWYKTLNEEDPGLKGKWWMADTDDSQWETVDLFSTSWQRDKYHQPAVGTSWFRRSFETGSIDTDREATLRMGCIVDSDSIFINGSFVGTTGYQYPPRIYKIPAGLLRPGKNVVAVRLTSNGAAPHFVEDKPYKIVQGDREVDLRGEWKYKRGAVMPPLQGGSFFGWRPTGLYNAMIHPLFGYKFKGAVWYQGESNVGRHKQYADLFPVMANTWRTGLGQPDLPFFVIQLPEFMKAYSYPTEGGWADMREVQAEIGKTLPRVATVVTLGTGEWNDIHPLDKKTIGDRLALAVRRLAYGENILASGPVYDSYEVDGNRIVLSFKEEGGKLQKNRELSGFAIAGADGKFVWAKAETDGEKVVIRSEEISEPCYVRYAWADNPSTANLRNTEGLPAGPFRIEIIKNN